MGILLQNTMCGEMFFDLSVEIALLSRKLVRQILTYLIFLKSPNVKFFDGWKEYFLTCESNNFHLLPASGVA